MRGELLLSLQDVAPDPAFARRVREWPDGYVVDALREFTDDYAPGQQRALVDELRRRGLPMPPRRRRPRPWPIVVLVLALLCLSCLIVAVVLV